MKKKPAKPWPLPRVEIRYHRPPDRTDRYVQHLLADEDEVKVTFARRIVHSPPLTVDGRRVLETGSDVVWFTFPGHWHDIGRFHRADGTFTGLYVNIVTPPTFPEPQVMETTDLFLDLWWPPDSSPRLLDQDEFARARARGWIDDATAHRAQEEARSLMVRIQGGDWPPAVVGEWTRARALAAM